MSGFDVQGKLTQKANKTPLARPFPTESTWTRGRARCKGSENKGNMQIFEKRPIKQHFLFWAGGNDSKRLQAA